MRHTLSYAAALCAAALMMPACHNTDARRQSSPTQPTGPILEGRPAQPPMETYIIRDAPARDITLGEAVEDRIKSSDSACTISNNRWLVPCRHFLVTAPKAGTLVATVTWDPIAWDMILLIRMGDRDFGSEGPPWSPVAARMKVDAGQQVRVMVGLAGFGDLILDAPFSLTTRME